MELNTTYFEEDILEFAEEADYHVSKVNVLGHPVIGQTLMTLTHVRELDLYSFVFIAMINEKELYRCVYKNIALYGDE